MNKPTHVYDIDSLYREKYRIKAELEVTERELADTYTYLKRNKRKIIWQHINPFEGEHAIGRILSSVGQAMLSKLRDAGNEETNNPLSSQKPDTVSMLALLIADWIKVWLQKRRERKQTAQKQETQPD